MEIERTGISLYSLLFYFFFRLSAITNTRTPSIRKHQYRPQCLSPRYVHKAVYAATTRAILHFILLTLRLLDNAFHSKWKNNNNSGLVDDNIHLLHVRVPRLPRHCLAIISSAISSAITAGQGQRPHTEHLFIPISTWLDCCAPSRSSQPAMLASTIFRKLIYLFFSIDFMRCAWDHSTI